MTLQLNGRAIAALKVFVFVACLVPAGRLAWDAANDALGANPIEAVTRGLGDWTLNFLLITLAVTPLRRLSGWAWLGRLRRMFGLFVFFYACLHLSSYLWFDQFFDWPEILRDIAKRPFITAGFVAFVLLVPLAATSTNAMVRRLGGRRWQQLHRTVYAISLIALLHYAWMVKRDLAVPVAYGVAVLLLLGIRAWWREAERRRQLAGAYTPPLQRVIPIRVSR
jgi:sulfoxide reductase heme-binding subunit YedZ